MVGAIQVSPCFDPAKQSPSLGWIVMDRGRIMNTVQGTNGSWVPIRIRRCILDRKYLSGLCLARIFLKYERVWMLEIEVLEHCFCFFFLSGKLPIIRRIASGSGLVLKWEWLNLCFSVSLLHIFSLFWENRTCINNLSRLACRSGEYGCCILITCWFSQWLARIHLPFSDINSCKLKTFLEIIFISFQNLGTFIISRWVCITISYEILSPNSIPFGRYKHDNKWTHISDYLCAYVHEICHFCISQMWLIWDFKFCVEP